MPGDGFRLIGVRQGRDPYGLIVPADVLIQFYMGTSTRLVQALLDGRFDTLYDKGVTRFVDKPGGTYRIRLLDDLAIDDGIVVSRYSASPPGGVARKAVTHVHRSLVRAQANRQPLCPAALFPVSGKTRLKALGIWLPGEPAFGYPVRRRFFVMRLLTCSGGFPYQRLEIEQLVPDEPETALGGKGSRTVVISWVPEQMKLESQKKPDSVLPPVTLPLASVQERFTAFKDIPMTPIAIPRARNGAGSAASVQAVVSETGSTAPGSAPGTGVHPVKMEHRPARRMDWQREEPPEIPAQMLEPSVCTPSVCAFIELLNHLKARPDVDDVLTRPVSDGVKLVSGWQFGGIPQGKGFSWHLMKEPGETPNQTRRRLLLLASVRVRGMYGHLIDLEAKGGKSTSGGDNTPTTPGSNASPNAKGYKSDGAMMLVTRPGGDAITLEALKTIVEIIRDNCQTFTKSTRQPKLSGDIKRKLADWTDLRIVSIFHNQPTVEACAERIVSEIASVAAKAATPKIPAQVVE